jgi:PST family polysaccharide transporter
MSLARSAARGALWSMLGSIGGRAIGVAGTLAMTRLLDPATIGEVNDAAILCMTAGWMTTWGWGQYAIVHGHGPNDAEVMWHATVMFVVPGLISFALISLAAPWLAPLFDAPRAAAYVPALALAMWIRRFGAVPERMLAREFRFRPIAIMLVAGETSYTVVALALAAAGFGGASIAIANIVQASVMVMVSITAIGARRWLVPTPWRWARIRDMARFGAPLGVGLVAHQASRYWDNLTVSRLFGPASAGVYNMAYNLADIPAIQVGEQVAQVMLPSLSKIPPERRADAFERSTALLSLVLFPLAVGLGLVAYPLIAWLLPANQWQEVAPLLTVLTCLSVFRPMTWMMSAYLESQQKTDRLMYLELIKLAILIGGLVLLAPFGLRVASCAVGLSFAVTAFGGFVKIAREGVSGRALLDGFVRPLLACAVMALGVFAVHSTCRALGMQHPATYVVADIIGGAAVYVLAASVIARRSSRELVALIANLRGPRKAVST